MLSRAVAAARARERELRKKELEQRRKAHPQGGACPYTPTLCHVGFQSSAFALGQNASKNWCGWLFPVLASILMLLLLADSYLAVLDRVCAHAVQRLSCA